MSQVTSLDMYYKKVLPHVKTAQEKVFAKLEDATLHGFEMTNMEIANLLGWSINRVTPRVKELRDQGRVVKAFIRVCGVTGHRAIAWKIKVNPK